MLFTDDFHESTSTLANLAALMALAYERLLASRPADEKLNHDKPINSKQLRRYCLDTPAHQSDMSCVDEHATCSGERRCNG